MINKIPFQIRTHKCLFSENDANTSGSHKNQIRQIRFLSILLAAIFSASTGAEPVTVVTQVTPNCTAANTVTLSDMSEIIIDGRASSVNGVGNENINPAQDFGPGTTICLKSHASGVNQSLQLTNLEGSAGNPIKIINTGGQVVFRNASAEDYIDMAIRVSNSRHLRITGTGSEPFFYGFKIDGQVGTLRIGVGYHKRSSDIELDHVEIAYTSQAAVSLSTFSNCSDGSVPARYASGGETPEFYDAYGEGLVLTHTPADYLKNYMHDYNADGVINAADASSAADMQFNHAIYHHNYIHHSGREGMYIGSNASFRLYKKTTHPDPFHSPGSGMGSNERRICQYYSDPELQNQVAFGNYNEPISGQLVGVKIYHNHLDHTGWDSINVKSSARDCDVFDNVITDFAVANHSKDQIGAIDVPINADCNIYRNDIRGGIDGGNGVAILASGVGGIIANNLILNVGRGNHSGRQSAIRVGMNTDSTHHQMYDANDQPLEWSDIFVGHQHHLINNTIVNPIGDAAIEFSLGEESHSIVNNLMVPANKHISVSGQVTELTNFQANEDIFESAAQGDYHLLPNTGAVNSGSDIRALFNLDPNIVTWDITHVQRPLQTHYDIGCYEYVSLWVVKAGSGTGQVVSQPEGIDCNEQCAYAFDDTTTVMLYTIDGYNSHFVGWEGCQTANNWCMVTGHHKITALFDADSFRISTFAGDNGSIDPAGPVLVAAGEDQTFTITPAPFYQVETLIVDGVEMGPLTTYHFDAVGDNHIIEARFIPDSSMAKLVHLPLDELSGSVASNIGSLASVEGLVSPNAQWTQQGIQQGALVFDGDDFVNLGQDAMLDFNPAQQNFTVSLWFKTTSGSGGALISKVTHSQSNVQFYLFTGVSDGLLYGRVGYNNTDFRTIKSGTDTVNDSQWHLATLVNNFETSKFSLYLDGNLLGTKDSGNMASNGMDILIGARRDGDNNSLANFFTGTIDDVRIYNRALSAVEIQDLFNGH